ncbi:right-handed parallel beta-helix repeat-containing protein [Algoriphagus sp. PAP.12]|uniref:right-handed parallel beta-helix repeat-containing protein n=1 Tax=Algoriphagus sp. PAP.12 TaxID=2996678 RepID=UPI00227C8712|nr:right-handed parallel beta-helix repeat-containing protein [Algoriphagus sp. PAP.12]
MHTKPRIILSLFLFCFSISLFAQSQKEFFVSQNGSDSNFGTSEMPFLTIDKAKATIKSLKEEGAKDAFSIILKEGTFYLEKPLVFGPEESGTIDSPYLIKAEKSGKVRISGGKEIVVNWKKYRGSIWVAKVPKGMEFSTLSIEGNPQIRARYPNFQEGVFPYGGYAEDALSPERIESWKNPEGGFIHALHRGRWGGMHYKITGKNSDGTLKYEGGLQNNRESEMHASMRFVENIFEELDSPGEWYLDEKKSQLFFYPKEGMDISSISKVEVSVLENLITLKGSVENPVRHIQIDGIVFSGTVPTFMKTEERLMRSDWTIYRQGAILMDGTEDCSVSNSEFRHLGGNGIFVSNYNRKAKISGNLIEYIGGSAISFVGNPNAVRSPSFNYHEFVEASEMDTIPGPKSLDYTSESLVFDNLIHDIGLIEKQVAGVQIQMAMDLRIAHNSIYNVPRAGINIGDGAWGGHIIEYNDVFNSVMETGDHGAFNSWGRDRFWHPNRGIMDSLAAVHPDWIRLDAIKTTIIRNNRFQCDHGWDIDLDDGSSNYEIYNNLCLSGGLKLREGFYRTVYNNVLINNGFHPHVWFKDSHDVFTRNISMSPHKAIRVNFWGDKVDQNFFTSESDLEKSRTFGIEASGLSGDPQFLDAGNGDFRVKPSSPAMQLGFENFDMDEFGVESSKLKKLASEPSIPLLLLDNQDQNDQVFNWRGYQIKNVATLGEQSAAGLNEMTGVLILNIPEGSFNQGIQVGDVILECWGEKVKNVIDLQKIEKANIWKGRVELKVWRNQGLVEVAF